MLRRTFLALCTAALLAGFDDPHVPPQPAVIEHHPPTQFEDPTTAPAVTSYTSRGRQIVVKTYKDRRQSFNDWQRDHDIHVEVAGQHFPPDPESAPREATDPDEGVGSLPAAVGPPQS